MPQIPKMLHYESSLSRKTCINLGGSAAKIRIRIGNSLWEFQIWGKKLAGSSLVDVSTHAPYKIG